jgi:glutamine synthetase
MPPDSSSANITSAAENSLGRPNFVALTGQDSPERQERLARILALIDQERLEVVRVACVDTHGIVRVRPIEARLFSQAARNGVAFTTAVFAMDSANNIFQNVFAADGGLGRETMGGAGDMLAMTDLATFRVLPGRINAAGSWVTFISARESAARSTPVWSCKPRAPAWHSRG